MKGPRSEQFTPPPNGSLPTEGVPTELKQAGRRATCPEIAVIRERSMRLASSVAIALPGCQSTFSLIHKSVNGFGSALASLQKPAQTFPTGNRSHAVLCLHSHCFCDPKGPHKRQKGAAALRGALSEWPVAAECPPGPGRAFCAGSPPADRTGECRDASEPGVLFERADVSLPAPFSPLLLLALCQVAAPSVQSEQEARYR
jgi:hypothetical protein